MADGRPRGPQESQRYAQGQQGRAPPARPQHQHPQHPWPQQQQAHVLSQPTPRFNRPVSSSLAANAPPPRLSIQTTSLDVSQGYGPPIEQMGNPEAMGGAKGPPVNLLIMNLPFRVRWQDLKDLCRQACDIERADVALELDGRSRGFGELTVGSRQDAQKLFRMFDGYEWMNRKLSVIIMDPPVPGAVGIQSPVSMHAGPQEMHSIQGMMSGMTLAHQPPPPPLAPGFAMQPLTDARLVFIGNLPFHIQWQDLKDLLRPAGRVTRAEVSLSREGRSRGWGTALFATEEEAQTAVRLFDGMEVGGRLLKVRKDRLGASGAVVPNAYTGAPPPVTQPTTTYAAPVTSVDPISRSVGVTPIPKSAFAAPPRSASMSMMQPPTPTSPMTFGAPRRAFTAEQQRQQRAAGQLMALPTLGPSRLSQQPFALSSPGTPPSTGSATPWEEAGPAGPWQGVATALPSYAKPNQGSFSGPSSSAVPQQQQQQQQEAARRQSATSQGSIGEETRHQRSQSNQPSNIFTNIWKR